MSYARRANGSAAYRPAGTGPRAHQKTMGMAAFGEPPAPPTTHSIANPSKHTAHLLKRGHRADKKVTMPDGKDYYVMSKARRDPDGTDHRNLHKGAHPKLERLYPNRPPKSGGGRGRTRDKPVPQGTHAADQIGHELARLHREERAIERAFVNRDGDFAARHVEGGAAAGYNGYQPFWRGDLEAEIPNELRLARRLEDTRVETVDIGDRTWMNRIDDGLPVIETVLDREGAFATTGPYADPGFVVGRQIDALPTNRGDVGALDRAGHANAAIAAAEVGREITPDATVARHHRYEKGPGEGYFAAIRTALDTVVRPEARRDHAGHAAASIAAAQRLGDDYAYADRAPTDFAGHVAAEGVGGFAGATQQRDAEAIQETLKQLPGHMVLPGGGVAAVAVAGDRRDVKNGYAIDYGGHAQAEIGLGTQVYGSSDLAMRVEVPIDHAGHMVLPAPAPAVLLEGDRRDVHGDFAVDHAGPKTAEVHLGPDIQGTLQQDPAMAKQMDRRANTARRGKGPGGGAGGAFQGRTIRTEHPTSRTMHREVSKASVRSATSLRCRAYPV